MVTDDKLSFAVLTKHTYYVHSNSGNYNENVNYNIGVESVSLHNHAS